MKAPPEAVHPSELIDPNWIVSSDEIRAGSIRVEHHMESSDEVSAPALTHHLLLVTLGSSSTRQITRIGDSEYDGPNESGNFSLSAADDKSSFWAWDGTDEVVMFSVDPTTLRGVAEQCGCVPSGEIILQNVAYGHDSRLRWFARQFREELAQESVGSRLYKDSLATLFELHLLRNYCNQTLALQLGKDGLGNRRLKVVLSYIEANISESIDLETLAGVAGLSKCHFSEMFKKSLGIPPYRYVLLQRIEKAKAELKNNRLPINEIALHCGFSDQSHLTKHFRKSVGMTPRKFRER